MCIRQPMSQDTRVLAPVATTLATLSASIPSEMWGYFTAKLPPNPQQVSPWGSSASRNPATFSSNWRGSSWTPNSRARWQPG